MCVCARVEKERRGPVTCPDRETESRYVVGELAERLVSLSPYDLFISSLWDVQHFFFFFFGRLSTRSKIVHLEVKIKTDKIVSLNCIKM